MLTFELRLVGEGVRVVGAITDPPAPGMALAVGLADLSLGEGEAQWLRGPGSARGRGVLPEAVSPPRTPGKLLGLKETPFLVVLAVPSETRTASQVWDPAFQWVLLDPLCCLFF